MSKDSEQGFQSPPSSCSSVTFNTAPFQAMQTVSMKCEWWLQFMIPVKKPLFLLPSVIRSYEEKLPFVLLLFGLVEFTLSNGNTVFGGKVLNSKASRILNGYFIRAFYPLWKLVAGKTEDRYYKWNVWVRNIIFYQQLNNTVTNITLVMFHKINNWTYRT